MKKILLALFSMFLIMGALSACNTLPDSGTNSDTQSESTEEEKEYCTLTFKQEGQPDIVKKVEKGLAYNEEWPVPVEKLGYNMEWQHECSDANWGNIMTDHVFTAVATPKEYTLYYAKQLE